MHKNIKLFILSIIVPLYFYGCGIITPKVQRENGIIESSERDSSILKYFSYRGINLSNSSAFYSLDDPKDAFASRLFLVDHAKKSIDIQYYIYENDKTGLFFSYRLLKAADRGVKIRILLDDLASSGLDREWRSLSEHKNIELRLFNPNRLRSSFRNLGLLFNIDSLGKRMHNKALIVDGSVAIVGGRNIGDVYFAADDDTLFFDYDILSIGKIVPEISAQFNLYWSSRQAVPAKRLLEGRFSKKEMRKKSKIFQNNIDTFTRSSFAKAVENSDFYQKVFNHGIKFSRADEARLYYDYPEKVATSEDDPRTHLSSRVKDAFDHIEKELTIISPYFIPGKAMIESFKNMRARGVKITVVTNSLASTDVFAVYSGYRWHIKSLLDIGVDLYELKPQTLKGRTRSKKWLKANRASLHTKMMVIDDYRLIVGSANIDPRSIKLNTELLLVIDSKKIAKRKQEILDDLINKENFYKLSWGAYPLEEEDQGMPIYGPIWMDRDRLYYSPPNSSYFRTLGTDILSILPIEGYL
ncbi:Cardiolipin synthetase [hydrothermal vent metagenome]|uniref:Cardiolipin synthetase n=1 Tax=hydrothermal vent metagenome TaxID=652676 RepID=A0A1W1BXV1_9ZZZZ